MGQNFDDYPGFQLMRSWANTYAQNCNFIWITNTLNSKIKIRPVKSKEGDLFEKMCGLLRIYELYYLDGLNVKAKGTSPEKLVSNPSRGNAKLNVTLKVQSLAALGARNLLFLDDPVCKVIDTK